MDLSNRPSTTGLAVASTMIVALSLILAPPPVLHGASSRVEARVLQLDAAVIAQFRPVAAEVRTAVVKTAAGVRPGSAAPISAAAAVTPTTNPLTSLVQGLQSIAVGLFGWPLILAFLGFIVFADVVILPLTGPDGQLPSWLTQLVSGVAKVLGLPGAAAVSPVNAASSVVKPNNRGTQAVSVTPKHVADTPIVATPALLAAEARHPKNTATPTLAVPTTKATAAPAAANGQSRSGRK
jgi:hypothetical protein